MSIYAFETDQYNLPPMPLADIGDEVSDFVVDNVQKAVTKVNSEISASETCLAKPLKSPRCLSTDAERGRLAFLRTGDAVALEVFKRLGDGVFPLSSVGHWLRSHKFRSGPARYKTSFQDSIYAIIPTNYLTISPTVRLYGREFGIDKIEHFFQQGYSYYRIYQKSVSAGRSSDAAARNAVKWGQMTERTYFGLLVSGVYSNADLYANYVGMKFYLGLAKPLLIGKSTRPPMLVLKEGRWEFNEVFEASSETIRLFISSHLNEALNPSVYAAVLFPFVKSVVRKRGCPQWQKTYPKLTRSETDAESLSLRLWMGENYGFTEKRRMISIGKMCFSD